MKKVRAFNLPPSSGEGAATVKATIDARTIEKAKKRMFWVRLVELKSGMVVCVRKDDSYTLKILIVFWRLQLGATAMIKPCGMKIPFWPALSLDQSVPQIVTETTNYHLTAVDQLSGYLTVSFWHRTLSLQSIGLIESHQRKKSRTRRRVRCQ